MLVAVEVDAGLIIGTIDEKISQPDKRLSRGGLPTALYTFHARTSNKSLMLIEQMSHAFDRRIMNTADATLVLGEVGCIADRYKLLPVLWIFKTHQGGSVTDMKMSSISCQIPG